MLINPTITIKNGWIQGIKNQSIQVQPNAIDFTLDKLFKVSNIHCVIGDTAKSMRGQDYVEEDNGWWTLQPQQVYDGTSDMYVEVPTGACAVLFTRSTFARNGVFVMSGLYDSGYKGHIGFTIYTIGGSISIQKGTRIGQIAFMIADSAHQYQGQWNHEQGTHYTENRQVDSALSNQKPLSEMAQELQNRTQWNSDQISTNAGRKTFL